jgi:2-polyprenyl-3-methyl-5-hydroxy-6-metoxy-1,4-benzoquinol methylase
MTSSDYRSASGAEPSNAPVKRPHKLRGTRIEDGLVVGNTYDKYGSRNPVTRLLMRGFFESLDRLVAATGAKEITEVGCGEGHLARHLARQACKVTAIDVSKALIDEARVRASEDRLNVNFQVGTIYSLEPAIYRNPLILCCEVLEHLAEPQRALEQLVTIADPHLILSVPREPIWRALNLFRLRYVRDLGNTPGHLNHWTSGDFIRLVSNYGEVVCVDSPFPWTMLLLKCR